MAEDRPTLIGDFVAAVREQVFQERVKAIWLKEKKEALNKVAEVFKSNNHKYPIDSKDGKQYLQLQLQFRGYKKKDPATKQNNISPFSSFANCFIGTSLTFSYQ